MTVQKPRDPGTHEDALSQIVAHFGNAKEAARIIGVGPGRIYSAMDADQLNHSTLNFDQMVKLGAAYKSATGNASPFVRAMRETVDAADGVWVGPDMTALERVSHVSREVNDVVQAITSAVCPSGEGGEKETRRECITAVREIDEAIAVLEGHRASYARKAGLSPNTRPSAVRQMMKEAS